MVINKREDTQGARSASPPSMSTDQILKLQAIEQRISQKNIMEELEKNQLNKA